jgi:hypothetical protein
VTDPNGDTVNYRLVIQGPSPETLGPQRDPISVTRTLDQGEYTALSIVDDGYKADTTAAQFESNPVAPTIMGFAATEGRERGLIHVEYQNPDDDTVGV